MRIRAAFLAAGLVAAPLPAQTQDDARAAIAAVLAHDAAARGPESGAETCVSAVLGGPPPAAGAEPDSAPDRSVRIRFQWHEPPAPAVVHPVRRHLEPGEPGERRQRRREPRPDPVPLPAPLAPELAARLDALRAEAAATARPVGASRMIDPALVPAPLRLQRPEDDCAVITLSTPIFAGDTAFVGVDFACGPICGNGGIYALQRREGQWQLVGIGDTWIR